MSSSRSFLGCIVSALTLASSTTVLSIAETPVHAVPLQAINQVPAAQAGATESLASSSTQSNLLVSESTRFEVSPLNADNPAEGALSALKSLDVSEHITLDPPQRSSQPERGLSGPNAAQFLLAQPETSNPDATPSSSEQGPDVNPSLPLPGSTTPVQPETQEPSTPATAKPAVPEIALDLIQIDSSYSEDNFGLRIFSIEPRVQYRLSNDNRVNFRAGYVSLTGQAAFGFPDVVIYPFRVGWEGRADPFTLRGGVTLNLYDRLPAGLGVDLGFSVPVLPNLIVGLSFERTPMKFAPSTLEIPNITSYTTYGPNLYWQIDNDTSLSSFFNFLQYNDGNRSQLSYTKLKRNFGQFSIAANLVTSSFDYDRGLLYFSPPDFLIYNGEVGWQGNLTEALSLRLQFNYGQQRLQGEYSRAIYYEIELIGRFSPDADAFLKYTFGDLQNIAYFTPTIQGNTLFSQSVISAQLRFRF